MSNGRILLYAPSHVLCKSQNYQSLALMNGWSAYSSGGGYRQGLHFNLDSSGYVTLEGLIVGNNATGAVIAVLPSGYRPEYTIQVHATRVSDNAVVTLVITNTGTISVLALNSHTKWTLSLANIRFKAEGVI